MEIITTYGELIEKGCWEDYCDMSGIDPYCMMKDPFNNDRNDEVILTLQEAKKIGFDEIKINKIGE